MSADKKPITKGHRYFFGIHMGIARHVDVLKEIRVGGRTAWKGAKSGQARWKITAATLFGGDDGEGGIHGTIDMMTGAADQPVNRRLAAMLGGLVPAFRGVCTLFYDGLVTSMSPYPKPWEVRGARTAGGWDGGTWYPEKVTIALGSIQAMNPAHLIYEAITNREWGRGKDRSLIDDVQWRASADALYAEGFGMCLAWKQSDKISSFIQSIIDHIGGAVVLNRRTGKLQLLLIRDNYIAADLPLFDEDSGLLSIEDDENAASAPAANEIIVTFTNPEAYGAQQQVRVQNAAAIASVGGAITETVEFLHLPTASLALRVAQRVLREKSVSKRLKVTLDRRGSWLQPGTPFRIRSTRRGIEEMVVRAGKVEDGTLAAGAVTVTAMQDAFGLPATSFVQVQPPEWVPPATEPLPATVRKPFELPYRDLVVGLTAADLAALHPTACAFGIMIRRPTNAAINYVLLTKAGGVDYNAAGTGDFCPSAQIVDAIDHMATTLKLTFVTDIAGFVPGQVGLIDDEIVQLVSVDWMAGGIAVIKRGCGDTVPTPHAAGARIWFYADSSAVDPIEYTVGDTVSAKVLPYSSGGWLDAALAPVDILSMVQRQYRPYPPGNMRIGGQYYPASVTGDVVLTWAHRDRLLQADQVVDTTQGNIGPEGGVTYAARLLRADDNSELASIAGAAGTTGSMSSTYSGRVIAELWSVRDGLESLQRHSHEFEYTSLIGLWTPAALPGLRMWLKSDNAGNVLVSDELSTISDLSGRGNHMTHYAGLAANRARLIQDGPNGRTVWRSSSDRTGSFVCTAADVLAASNAASGLTAAIVHRSYPSAAASGAGNHMFVAGRNGAADQARILLSAGFNSAGARYTGGRRLDTDSNVQVIDSVNRGTNWLVMVGINDYSAAASRLSINGTVTASSSSFQTAGNTSATNGAAVSVGHPGTGLQQALGDYAEVVYVRGALDTADRQKLEGYLAWSWGLTSGLPAGHPYKSAPPAL